MTQDDIRRLVGGYATGSLTESERKLLFEAALEDQDLFEQLAREQALKELIDQPGARDRLIAALAPAETSHAIGGWKRPLAWGLAAMFVVSMSIAAVMLTRSGIRTQMAQRETAQATQPAKSPAPAVTVPVTPPLSGSQSPDRRSTKSPESPSKNVKKPVAKAAAADKLETVQPLEKDGRRDANAPAKDGNIDAVKPAPVASAAALSGASPSRPQIVGQVGIIGQISPPPIQPQGFVAGQAPGVPRAPQAQTATQITTGQASNPQVQNSQVQTGHSSNSPVQSVQAENGRVQTARNQVQVRAGQTQVQSGGGGGGRGGAGLGGAIAAAPMAGRAAPEAKSAPAHFAFDYSIEGEDLVFKFVADGYFSLHIAPGGLTIVDSRVTAGSTRRERITTNGTEAVIIFSASPQSTAQGVSIESRARSGTVEDPARKRVDLLLKFY